MCTRKKKGIRSKIIIDYISELLKDGLNLTEEDYHKYYDGLINISDEKREKLQIELHSKQAILKDVRGRIKIISLNLIEKKNLPPKVIETATKELDELQDRETELMSDITKIKQQITDPEATKLTIEQFLNLSKNAGSIVQKGNPVLIDQICRYIFLNFFVDEEKVVSYQLKPPFDAMLKLHDVKKNRDDRT